MCSSFCSTNCRWSACRILSLDGLLLAKQAAERKKDMDAIEHIKALIDLKRRAGI